MFHPIRRLFRPGALVLVSVWIYAAASAQAGTLGATLDARQVAYAFQEEDAQVGTTRADRVPGPGTLVGITYFDRQNPGSMGRMIGPGYSAACGLLVHMAFVRKASTFGSTGLGYGVYECDFGLQSTVGPLETGWRSVGLDVTGDNRALSFGHTAADQSRFLWDDNCGDGTFSGSSPLPDNIWPHAVYSEIGPDTILHVVALSPTTVSGGGRQLLYWRRVGGPLVGTWDVPPEILDTVYNFAHDLTVSPLGGRVVAAWMAPRNGASDLDRDNDLYYAYSLDNGVIWSTPINVTNNADGVVGYRPDNDLSLLIDSFDDLHLVWSDRKWPADAASADTMYNRSRIAHWAENDAVIHTVHDADWPYSNCTGGQNAMNVAKVALSECSGNLYCLFVQFNDVPNGIIDDCHSRAWSSGTEGAANGELWVTVSSNRGANWDTPRNLTNSYTPFCDSTGFGGPCGSENWVSAAPFGTDLSCPNTSGVTVIDPTETYSGSYFLDVQYIDDPSPGSFLDGEGTEAACDVRWFRLACIPPDYDCNLTLLRPEAGETFFTGETQSHSYLVRWEKTPTTLLVNIQRSLNGGGTWATIASNISGDSWLWTLNPGDPTSDNYRLRVVDASNGACLDEGAGAFQVFSTDDFFRYQCQTTPLTLYAQAKVTKSTIVNPAPDKSPVLISSSRANPMDLGVAFIGATNTMIFVAMRVSGCVYTEFHDIIGVSGFICDLDLADFDNDGYVDIVISDNTNNAIKVFINRGDLTFYDTPVTTPLAGGVCALEVVDENGDGSADLFVHRVDTEDLYLLYGNGDGTFTPSKATVITACDPCLPELGYFNDDDYVDIAVARQIDDGVSIWHGNGSGTFTQQTTVGGLPDPVDMLAEDFNLDGRSDLGIIYSTAPQFTAIISTAPGVHGAFHTPLPHAGHSAIEAADFTGDGFPDVVISIDGPDSLIILPGVDSGTTKSSMAGEGRIYFSYPTIIPIGKDPIDLEIFDHNSDNLPDLLILTPGDSSVWIHEGGLTPSVLTSITLTSPNGGETWAPGSQHSISWTSDGIVSVNLEVSRDSGQTWQPIASGVLGSDFTWTVTDPTTTQALIRVSDSDIPVRNDASNAVFAIQTACCNLRGDVDHSGGINVGDLTYLVEYLFKGGPAPACPDEGDVSGDGNINVGDLTYLVSYIFKGGPAPPPC